MIKLKQIWLAIVLFFNETKLGHFLKTSFITFTGIFFGMLFASPVLNELFKLDLPTINQLKDIWPVIVDTFFRSVWAFVLVQLGVYKYSSSEVENKKSNIIPDKQSGPGYVGK